MDVLPEDHLLDSDDLDLLQEIMNIAFGRAASDLAEFINLFVVLSVPQIKLISADEVCSTLSSEMDEVKRNVSVVSQEFWGNISGSAVLCFPAETEHELISIMGNSDLDVEFDEISTSLAQETLMELGNILTGACSGKLAALLETTVSYSPPFALVNEPLNDAVEQLGFQESEQILVLKTRFTFEGRDLSGLLLIAEQKASFAGIKKALKKFLEQYE